MASSSSLSILKPDFRKLARKYFEVFGKYVTTAEGQVFVDFTDPVAVRCVEVAYLCVLVDVCVQAVIHSDSVGRVWIGRELPSHVFVSAYSK